MIRSFLYAPAIRPELMAKAVAGHANAVVFDLEDAVAEHDKPQARANIGAFFQEAEAPPTKPVIVRINAGPTGLEDLVALAGLPLAGIRLPKAETGADVQAVAARLDEMDMPDAVSIECLIESAQGLVNMPALAEASPRMRRFGFGASDFKRDIGARTSPGRTETLFARGQIVVMSRALGLLPPVTHVYTPIRDLEGLRAACEEDAILGFGARSCIHPSHIDVINDAFQPPQDEVNKARRIVAAYEDEATPNRGAFTLDDGTFVDLATYRRALDLVSGDD